MIESSLLLEYGATIREVRAGETIFNEGEVCTCYYEVIDGKVRWQNTTEQGREYLQFILGPGQSFGEIPLFDDEPYVSSATAVADSRLWRLPKPIFHQLVMDHPEVLMRFTRLLASRIRFKFFVQKEMASANPERCITSLFHFMQDHGQSVCPKCNLVTLTRQEIADMTGMRVETVIRAIRKMNEQGVVRIDKGKVFLPMREVIKE